MAKILVIDDEQAIRVTAEAILSYLGFEVLLAENGKLGIELFAEHHSGIDLVILDMVMPEMDGEECFRQIMEIDPAAKVLLASGFSRESNIDKLKNEGLRGFIRKPYTTIELSQSVAKVLLYEDSNMNK